MKKKPSKRIDEMFALKGQVTLISGIGGIGETLAECFAANGARLILTDINTSVLERVKTKLSKQAVAADTYFMNVTQKSSIQEVFDTVVGAYGRIDIVIITSGVAINDKAIDFCEADIDRILGINLKGTILCNQVAGKIMARQKGGKIINIGSIGGLMAHTLRSMPYAASKAGVHQVTRSFATELAQYGVNVNAIAPIWVNTQMTQGKDPSYYENIKKGTPFGRMCEPIELVGAAIFLATEASNFVTGQVIFVDGGWSISKALT
jgi:NAD(P)-dependent dehydrogenase (short-subunit alcohol dehydrogenase family)